jgi:hypothetical protein
VARAGFVVFLALIFVAIGALGVFRYARGYWLYRGFPPPRDPAYVSLKGTTERVYVSSPALGGRRQPVDVYLPPGYATSTARYPVFYLLHGFPGRPGAFLQTVRMGVVEDVLLARRRIRPFILVMPFGSTGSFTAGSRRAATVRSTSRSATCTSSGSWRAGPGTRSDPVDLRPRHRSARGQQPAAAGRA